MDASDVHAVLDALATAGCRAWVAGGWGVDALVGRQTRPHRDLDLAIDARAEYAALAQRGDVVETDWRPVRVEVAAPGGRSVDLHPVAFDETGNGVQAADIDGGLFTYPVACFVTGFIADRLVGCLSVQQQVSFTVAMSPGRWTWPISSCYVGCASGERPEVLISAHTGSDARPRCLRRRSRCRLRDQLHRGSIEGSGDCHGSVRRDRRVHDCTKGVARVLSTSR